MTNTALKYIVCIMTACFVISCGTSVTKRNPDIQNIRITLAPQSEYIDAGDYLDTLRIVPLQTGEDAAIGEISSIRIRNGKIYIVDAQSEALFIFDTDGTLLGKLSAQGRGPNEYMNLSDIEISDDGSIWLLDYITQKLLVYDSNLDFKKSISTSEVWGNYLSKCGEEILLINDKSSSQTGYYCLYRLNNDNQTFTPFIPFDESLEDIGWALERYHTALPGKTLCVFPPFDTIYSYENGRAQAKYLVDFGKDKMDREVIMGDSEDALMESFKSLKTKGVDEIDFIGTDKLLLRFKNKDTDFVAIHDEKSGTVSTGNHLVWSRYGNLPMDKTFSDNGFFISYLFPYDFSMIYSDENMAGLKFGCDSVRNTIQCLRNNVSETDNPILFIGKTIM